MFTPTDGKHSAYFRGRKLQGRSVKLPEGYKGTCRTLSVVHLNLLKQGSILQTTDKVLVLSERDPLSMNVDEDDDEEDKPLVETKIVEERATFNEVMIWGHETTADATDDPYTKGMEEWISFAEAVSPICWLVITRLMLLEDAFSLGSQCAEMKHLRQSMKAFGQTQSKCAVDKCLTSAQHIEA
jgi:hypothetical protein